MADECAVEGCERVPTTRGLCIGHYTRLRYNGEVQASRPLRGGPRLPTCSEPSCSVQSEQAGVCHDHYLEQNFHGWRSSKTEYRIWSSMKRRCLNPKDLGWERYGGRGITVCAEWQASFDAFLAYMGPRPSLAHSIDRIDNDGNYEPGNVRWATWSQQNANKRPSPRKPECTKGHAMTEANTFWTKDGYRRCLVCQRAGQRRYVEKQKAKRASASGDAR